MHVREATSISMWMYNIEIHGYPCTGTVGHKSHDSYFHVFLKEAGDFFVTDCTTFQWIFIDPRTWELS